MTFRTKISGQKILAPADWFTVHRCRVSFGNDSHTRPVISKRKFFVISNRLSDIAATFSADCTMVDTDWSPIYSLYQTADSRNTPQACKKLRGHIEGIIRYNLEMKVISKFLSSIWDNRLKTWFRNDSHLNRSHIEESHFKYSIIYHIKETVARHRDVLWR